MKGALALAAILLGLSSYAQTGAVRGGQLPQPLPLFPKDNWWNVDVSAAPVDLSSATYINFIGATRSLHPDFGGDAGGGTIYGMPYVTVPGTQVLVPVTFDYASESDPGAPGQPSGYPIPPEARTQHKWIEGGLPGSDPNASGDRHMLIVDRDNRRLYELFALRWSTTGQRWEAGSGAVFSLDSNFRRPEGWTSADAAGLAILPGLVRYEEVHGLSAIRHAFRVTVRATNGYVYPASHRAGSTAGALPMGARLRLKPGKDISSFPEPVRRIFQAMKTYGLIVADNGSDMYITGTHDTRWNNDVLNPAFRQLTAGDFEVIRLGWTPASVPACPPPNITLQPADQTITRGGTATLSVAVESPTPLTYRWFEGSSGDVSRPQQGGGGVLNVSPAISTAYWVRTENSCGSSDSVAASVTLTDGAVRGDINGDRKPDLLWRSSTNGENYLWIMSGATRDAGVSLPPVQGEHWEMAGAGDFSGDGSNDLLWRNRATGENYVWLMNDADHIGGVRLDFVSDPLWRIVSVGDFDRNGYPDLLWRRSGTGENYIWLMEGTRRLSGVLLPVVRSDDWIIAGAGDLDGDQSLDIVWRNSSTGENYVWKMRGPAYQSGFPLPWVGDPGWEIGAIADFDANGFADLIWRHRTRGENFAWFMSSAGVHTGVSLIFVPAGEWDIVGPR
jgi:hypothetical protein